MLYKWWFCSRRGAKTGFGTQIAYKRGVDNDEEVRPTDGKCVHPWATWGEVFTKRRAF